MPGPILWGPNSTANNLENQILQANGSLLQNDGSKNYITYNNFENGLTTGWSLGTTGTLTNGIPTGTPTFGSGASGNLSISTTSSSPISGTYSLLYASSAATTAGNMLATQAYSIDAADQAKVLTGKFYYNVPVNPTNGNFSGTSSNSFGIACWDVTNSSWLPVVGNFAMTQNSGTGIATVTMQTNVTTASVRFVLYNANASAGAITLELDRFYLGPQTAPIGPIVTDWQAFTPTGSWSSNSTYTGFWRRIGDNLQVEWKITLSGAPNAANLTLNLPSGFTIDATKIDTSTQYSKNLGAGEGFQSPNAYLLQALYGSTTSISVAYVNNGTTATEALVSNTLPVTWASGNTIIVSAQMPIAGWSSNVQMSNDTDTRVIAAQVGLTSDQAVSAGAPIKFDTIIDDNSGSYSTSTGIFTVPVSGYYRVSFFGLTSASASTVQLTKNGVLGGFLTSVVSTVVTGSSTTIKANAGDALSINSTSAVTYDGNTSPAFTTSMSIERLSGPAVIAASETVACNYQLSGAVASGSAQPIDFSVRNFDTHLAVTTGSSWKFTAPMSGIYQISTTLASASSGCDCFVYKNGSSTNIIITGISNAAFNSGTILVSLNAGEYLDVRFNVNQNTNASTSQSISIMRVK